MYGSPDHTDTQNLFTNLVLNVLLFFRVVKDKSLVQGPYQTKVWYHLFSIERHTVPPPAMAACMTVSAPGPALSLPGTKML